MLAVNLTLFIIACIVLFISGAWLVKSLIKIAMFLRASEFIVGFVIMAFATTVPEFSVGITSALSGQPEIALGTVIGSNIANLTIVFGIVVVLARGIKISSKKIKKDALWMFAITLLPLTLMIIGKSISRIDGVILLAALVLYIWRMFRMRKEFRREMGTDHIKRREIVFHIFFFVFSLIVLFVSAKFVVQYATIISIELMLPTILIALFLIALGTSLPELVFQTRAVLSKHPDMAIGDAIGAVVLNSTWVLGTAAIIHPITSNFVLFLISGVFMVMAAFLFATFVESGSKIYIKEGLSLIFFYLFFIMVELYVKGIL